MYALFLRPVVSFWGSLDPPGGFRPKTPNLPTPEKLLQAPMADASPHYRYRAIRAVFQ